MKKLVRRIIIFSTIIFSLTGCKNFFVNANLLDDIKDCVQYQSSPCNNVIILSDSKATKSIVPSVGVYDDTYKVTDKIYLSFIPTANYYFYNWLVEPEDSVEFVDSTENDSEAVLKIVKEGDITIQAICGTKDTLNIVIKSDYATVSPTEQAAFYNEPFEVTCREEADYYFLNWEVYDSLGNLIPDYSDILKIKEPSSRITEVTAIKTGMAVFIKPKLVIRPKVIAATPKYDINGSFRDSTIVLMFNTKVEQSCIYFSETEMTAFEASGFTLLKDPVHENKCYGYINSEGNIIYKNLKITDAINENANYLKYFKAPFFDAEHPDILRIPAKTSSLPPAVANIMVTVSKDFYYPNPGDLQPVPMNGDYSFIYRTNEKVDSYPPYFGMYDELDSDFAIREVPASGSKEYSTQLHAAYLTGSNISDEAIKPKAADIIRMNLSSGKLWFRGVVCDGDSGPANVKWDITKVDCKLSDVNDLNIYPADPEHPFHINGTLCSFQETQETEKLINQELDLSSYNLTEGFYKLDLLQQILLVCSQAESIILFMIM